MNWLPALLTLAGTIVGASITLTADRMRWRRDQGQRQTDARREVYAAYLTALHATSEGIRAVSLGDHDPDTSRATAARAVFRSANLNAAREQIVLLAQAAVVRLADRTFTSLRSLRDIVGQHGEDLQSSTYQQVLGEYQSALKELRNLMRTDLGTVALEDDVTF